MYISLNTLQTLDGTELIDFILESCEEVMFDPESYDSVMVDLYCTARVLKRYEHLNEISEDEMDPDDPVVQLYRAEWANLKTLIKRL